MRGYNRSMETSPQSPRGRGSILAEIGVVVFCVEVVALAAILLPRIWPAAGPYQGFIIALAFLYAPVLADRWARERPPPVPGGAALRSLRMGFLVAAIVLPLFAVGNHLVQKHFHGRALRAGPGGWLETLKDWPAEWEGRPPALDSDEPRVWVDSGLLVVLAPVTGSEVLRVDWTAAAGTRAPRHMVVVEGDLRENGQAAPGPATLASGMALVFSARAVESITVDGTAEVLVGATGARRDAPRSQKRGWAWWLWILASQVILIALPEEVFYRGWLQPRLRRVWPGGLKVLGVSVGPAIFVTSVLFALGHVVTIPAAFRLAVFFPSLLFGWLRDRTDHLAGPVAMHVLSNLAMLTVMRFYG